MTSQPQIPLLCCVTVSGMDSFRYLSVATSTGLHFPRGGCQGSLREASTSLPDSRAVPAASEVAIRTRRIKVLCPRRTPELKVPLKPHGTGPAWGPFPQTARCRPTCTSALTPCVHLPPSRRSVSHGPTCTDTGCPRPPAHPGALTTSAHHASSIHLCLGGLLFACRPPLALANQETALLPGRRLPNLFQ